MSFPVVNASKEHEKMIRRKLYTVIEHAEDDECL